MKKSIIIIGALLFLIQGTLSDFINESCNKTPHPNLCVSIVRPDPRSEDQNVDTFAFILVGEVEVKASDALQAIGRLAKIKPVSDCQNSYAAVVRDNVPQAENEIQGGGDAGKRAAQLMDDVVGKADSCERGFRGHSLLTSVNNAVKDVSSVAAAMSRLI